MTTPITTDGKRAASRRRLIVVVSGPLAAIIRKTATNRTRTEWTTVMVPPAALDCAIPPRRAATAGSGSVAAPAWPSGGRPALIIRASPRRPVVRETESGWLGPPFLARKRRGIVHSRRESREIVLAVAPA